ncbi:DUF1707 domain-containing protein [Streptomyces sp. NPDC048172]|uniref:DUF1707 SHOCT-like domain-containing protein n=1 Tax=Streptomyces sp. NPDC048172 TaxID=3365505 RepID=UPI0037130DEC
MLHRPTTLSAYDSSAPPTTRASDTDRNIVLTILGTALANGRLDQAERDDRSSAALAAQTLAELASVTSDLPEADDRAREVRRARRRAATLKKWIKCWRIWAQVALCTNAFWAADSLARKELTAYWPAYMLGTWAAVLLACMLSTLKNVQRSRL